jgi:alkylation response protein AidB-like acyl-CoA dehydrogenase
MDIAARAASAAAALRALPGSSDEFRPAAVDAIRAAGLHLLTLPPDLGGLGGRMGDAVDVLAEIAAADAGVALGLAMQTHVVGSAVESGAWPSAPFDRLVAAIRDEGALINAASTEDGSGSPSRGGLPDTSAIRDGAPFRVTGEKTFTTWLPALRFALVSVRLSGPEDPEVVVGNLLVDLESPGIERLPGFDALGMRGSASGLLVLRDVVVPAEMLVLRRGPRDPDPRGASAPGWFGMVLAATYLGVGESARAEVVRWAIERRPGDGSTSVAEIPTVQVRLGRLDAGLRAARLVVADVARRWDEAETPAARAVLLPDVSLAKITATNAAASATDEALRIAGGPGFVAGPIERAFRDARAGLINPPLDDVAFQGFAKALVDRERAGG